MAEPSSPIGRVLTVRQPWAWAIVAGHKTVENRTGNLAARYRGPVAIHSALTFDESAEEANPATLQAAMSEWLDEHDPPDGARPHDWPWRQHGAIIGVVDLVDVHLSKLAHTRSFDGASMLRPAHPPIGSLCSPWADVGQPRDLPPRARTRTNCARRSSTAARSASATSTPAPTPPPRGSRRHGMNTLQEVRQPMPRPTTVGGSTSGVRPAMIDTHGHLLELTACAECGREHLPSHRAWPRRPPAIARSAQEHRRCQDPEPRGNYLGDVRNLALRHLRVALASMMTKGY